MTLINDRIVIKDKLTAIADGFRESNGTTAKLSLDEMADLAKQGSRLVEDLPTTQGQWACLARASQMRDIKYQVKANMTNAHDTNNVMHPNTDYTGLIYSSVRALDWGFIGFGTSVYSYLTTLNNPKSIAYTKKYTDYFPLEGANPNVSNVFGTNCSEFVSYCLDLPYLMVTAMLRITPNMERICFDESTQAVDTIALQREMKLCDVPLSTSVVYGHTVFVTGIRRNNDGLIMEVDISDSWPPRIRKTTYTWNEFVEKFINTEEYTIYRYTALDSVTFPQNLNDIVYSDIVTNRGDKVCIRPNQDISLNVLNASNYVGIVLFKDGVQVNSQASTDDWELTGLTTGKYTAILYNSGETVTIDDANENNSTSFIVCDVTLSKSGNVYTYSAEAVNGVFPTPVQIALKDAHGFTHQFEIIENNNFTGSGSVEVVPITPNTILAYPSIIHLPFKTEYGFVIAEYIVE